MSSNSRPPQDVYQAENGVYYTHHDFDGPAKLSTTVIHALGEVHQVDLTKTETTLFQYIDPDALDDIFRPLGPETPRVNGLVQFSVWGYNVAVYSDGYIEITVM